MFCPSCGASNPEDARFCNQCGVGLGALPGDAPSTLSGPGARSAPGSAQGARAPSLRGGGTLDRVELPMHGPTRGRFALVVGVTGVLGVALGAALAYRRGKAPETIPVTPVGLVGEPAPLVAFRPSDGGVRAGEGATARGAVRGGAVRSPVARDAASGTAGGASTGTGGGSGTAVGTPNGTGGGSGTAGGASTGTGGGSGATAGASNGTGGGSGATAGASNGTGGGSGATAGASNGTGTAAPDENGVVERGPRVTSGGFGLGDETDATGTMDGQVFSYVYNHYRTQISACYSSASRTRPVSGVIVLRVRIGTDGRVVGTRVMSDTARVPELSQCVQTAVRAWRYPQPEGGEVEVDYPMRFGSST